MVGNVQTEELVLPDSVEGELVVSIRPFDVTCGWALPGTGVLIDDLRAE